MNFANSFQSFLLYAIDVNAQVLPVIGRSHVMPYAGLECARRLHVTPARVGRPEADKGAAVDRSERVTPGHFGAPAVRHIKLLSYKMRMPHPELDGEACPCRIC